MAGTLADVRTQLYQAFVAAWSSTAPFCFDNEAFKPTDGVPWVRASLRNLTSKQETLGATGNRRFERGASFVVQSFTVLSKGLAVADAQAQIVRNTLEAIRIQSGDVRTYAAQVREIGPTDDGWYQMNIDVPLFYTEIR